MDVKKISRIHVPPPRMDQASSSEEREVEGANHSGLNTGYVLTRLAGELLAS